MTGILLCEDMATLICHASLLKVDDLRLKDAPPSSRVYENCHLFSLECIHHILMQCPGYRYERDAMYSNIYNICNVAVRGSL